LTEPVFAVSAATGQRMVNQGLWRSAAPDAESVLRALVGMQAQELAMPSGRWRNASATRSAARTCGRPSTRAACSAPMCCAPPGAGRAGRRGGRHRTRKELAAVLESAGIRANGQRLAHLVMHAEFDEVLSSGAMSGKQQSHAAFDERVPPASAFTKSGVHEAAFDEPAAFGRAGSSVRRRANRPGSPRPMALARSSISSRAMTRS
jgi:hypothetical protein